MLRLARGRVRRHLHRAQGQGPLSDAVAIPRRLAVALYASAQAAPDRIVRGRVRHGRAGLVLLAEGEASDDPLFAAFRSQPEGTPPPDQAELEVLLAEAPLVLVASRATRGVMVLGGFRRGATGVGSVAVRIEDAERDAV